MDEKFKSFLLKAPSKKTSGPASFFDKYLETFKVPIEPASETSFRDEDDDGFLQGKTQEDKRPDEVYFQLTFLVFKT